MSMQMPSEMQAIPFVPMSMQMPAMPAMSAMPAPAALSGGLAFLNKKSWHAGQSEAKRMRATVEASATLDGWNELIAKQNITTPQMNTAEHIIKFASTAQSPSRVLSSLLEIDHGSIGNLRSFAYYSIAWGNIQLALYALEVVAKQRNPQPQSTRDLAFVLLASGQNQRAADLLAEVIGRQLDGLYTYAKIIGVNDLSLFELRGLITRSSPNVECALQTRFEYDLRVVVTCNEEVDVELIIEQPGEKLNSFHNLSDSGSILTPAIVGVPIEYLCPRASDGDYEVVLRMRSPVRVQFTCCLVQVFTNFGREQQRLATHCIELSNNLPKSVTNLKWPIREAE